MQDIWRLKFDWDDELSQDLLDRWISWANGLPSLDGLTLDRCITPTRDDVTAIELHIFGDASEMGFGAVSYAVLSTQMNQLMSNFSSLNQE